MSAQTAPVRSRLWAVMAFWSFRPPPADVGDVLPPDLDDRVGGHHVPRLFYFYPAGVNDPGHDKGLGPLPAGSQAPLRQQDVQSGFRHSASSSLKMVFMDPQSR